MHNKFFSALGLTALAAALTASPFPVSASTEPSAKIHFLALGGTTDAILLESNGLFAMVDSGEDSDYPDNTDKRYPFRLGTSTISGFETEVVDYMKKAGVTKDNFVFYLGTHAHSDHIGSADTIIREFEPERVYLAEYSDSYISDPNCLFDNLYIYDQAVAAAKEVGATLIQYFSPDAPLLPNARHADYDGTAKTQPESISLSPQEVTRTYDTDFIAEGSGKRQLPSSKIPISTSQNPNETYGRLPADRTGNPNFRLGNFSVEITNYSNDYQYTPKPSANMMSLGVKVSANGHTAFLSGDIDNSDGDEYRLKNTLGNIELLKLGHHGYSSANTPEYLNALSPKLMVCTGSLYNLPPHRWEAITKLHKRNNTKLYATKDSSSAVSSIIFDFQKNKLTTDYPQSFVSVFEEQRSDASLSPKYAAFRDGWYHYGYGPFKYRNNTYFLDNDCYAVRNAWKSFQNNYYYLTDNGKSATGWLKNGKNYYYMNKQGIMQTGWVKDDDRWFYLNSSGAMKTGWLYNNGSWFYLNNWGSMQTGWRKINGKWYYLDSTGEMQTGWLKLNGSVYYLKESGVMATGELVLDDVSYEFARDGVLIRFSETL